VFSRKRPAFTLLEILISVMAGAALSAVLLQAAFYFLTLEKRILRDALARERGQNVLSILEPRVLHAGLGLTWGRAGDVFQRSFGGSAASTADAPPPARWSQGPLQIWEGYPALWSPVPETGGVHRGRGISVLYAVPSALKANLGAGSSVDMPAGAPLPIDLVLPENLDGDDIDDRLSTVSGDLKSWVAFPLTRLPVHVSSYSYSGEKRTLHLTVRPAGGFDPPAALRFYDEMHYLRAERFQTQNGRLYSQELRTAWTDLEERLEGVLEMWFEWTPSKRLLEAWILTTGGESAENGRPWEWPEEAPWRDAEFKRQNLAVTRGSWILRNIGPGP
jgi:hypothetical protein